MFGCYDFVNEAKKNDIKPILGCEFYLVEDRHKQAFLKSGGESDKRFHQLFLAKNAEGYENLSRLCSLGYIEGMYGKFPRIDKELILKYHKGIIATRLPSINFNTGYLFTQNNSKAGLQLFNRSYYLQAQYTRVIFRLMYF